jgi:hypothetical protein
MITNLQYDQSLSFGWVDLTGADLTFPNVINLDAARIDRCTVDLRFPAQPEGGTGLTVTVEGLDAPDAAQGTTIGSRSATLAELTGEGVVQVAINPNDFPAVRVTFTKSGTFTAGAVEAILNTYIGT